MASSNLEFSIPGSLNGAARTANGTINEFLIEQYVRYADTLDAPTRSVVSSHIKSYLSGTAIERFYRQFYDEYDRLEGKISPKVDAFVSSLFE